MKPDEHRIYGKNVEIPGEAVKRFWARQAATAVGTAGTLLGNHGGEDLTAMKNALDRKLFRECTEGKKQRILEFGCGNGRWAELLADVVESYAGIDFAEEFIAKARALFQGDGRFRFAVGTLTDLPMEFIRGGGRYTMGICSGCVMYLNDGEARKFYESVEALPVEALFFKEKVSTMEQRLTLVDFPSKELQTDYNVVYRMPSEYEEFYRSALPGFRIARKGWEYPEEKGIWSETNTHYWHLVRA